MIVALFLVREVGLEPTRSPIRPLNARVCRFRHSRKCKYKYIANLHFCQSIVPKKLQFVGCTNSLSLDKQLFNFAVYRWCFFLPGAF